MDLFCFNVVLQHVLVLVQRAEFINLTLALFSFERIIPKWFLMRWTWIRSEALLPPSLFSNHLWNDPRRLNGKSWKEYKWMVFVFAFVFEQDIFGPRRKNSQEREKRNNFEDDRSLSHLLFQIKVKSNLNVHESFFQQSTAMSYCSISEEGKNV